MRQGPRVKLELQSGKVRISAENKKGCTGLSNVGFLDKVLVPGYGNKSRASGSYATMMQEPQQGLLPAALTPLAELPPTHAAGPTWASSSCFLANFISSLSSFSRRADSLASSRFRISCSLCLRDSSCARRFCSIFSCICRCLPVKT